MMLKLLVLPLFLVSSPRDQYERALDAFEREAYAEAGELLGNLVSTEEEHTLDRGGLAIAAGNAWRFEYEKTSEGDAVCEGIDLLRRYMMASHNRSPDIAADYWSLVSIRSTNDIACTPEPLATVVTEPNPLVLPPRPPIRLPVASPSLASAEAPRNTRPLKIAGGVLTASAGVGLGIFTGLAAVYAQRLEAYRLVDGPDEDLYRQGLKIQRWTIATGVTACAALVTGVTLLVSARRKTTTVQPSIGGLIVQGKF